MTKLVNRAKMTTATTGTGTITLGSAEAGYQSFTDAGVVDGDVVRYVIEDGTAFEIGTGTFTATGTTLTRTVSESSNEGSPLVLTGNAVVYVSATAEDIPPVLELYAENPSSPTAPSATGTNAVAIGSGAVASGTSSVALATLSETTGNFAVAIGAGADALGKNAVGIKGEARYDQTTAIGTNSGTGRSIAGIAGNSTSNAAMALGGSYASGTDSFAAAIANNTSSYGATGANSVAIGDRAKSNTTASIALGRLSEATGTSSAAIGTSTKASANNSVAIITGAVASGGNSISVGAFSTASANNSVSIGVGANSSIIGKFSYSNGGIAFGGYFPLHVTTSDATPATLTTDGTAAGTTDQIILPNNSAYAFHGTIVARQQASQGTACAAFKIEGLIRREGNAASTVLVNSATTVLDNTPGWGMALSADTTNGGLKIEVTGAAATNIRWVCTCHTSEVTY